MSRSLIPNTLTSINLACGIIAIILMDPLWSPTFVLFGAIADVFDGAVARLLGAAGDFGVQLDSLADLVTFGIAPTMVFAVLYLENIYIIIGITIFSGICAALRLAKFNLLESSSSFSGLPSPAHGLFVTGILFALLYEEPWASHFPGNSFEGTQVQDGWPYYLTLIAVCFTALLMVSSIHFTSLKGIKKERPTQVILALVIITTIISAIVFPAHFIWVGIGSYILFSLLGMMVPKVSGQ